MLDLCSSKKHIQLRSVRSWHCQISTSNPFMAASRRKCCIATISPEHEFSERTTVPCDSMGRRGDAAVLLELAAALGRYEKAPLPWCQQQWVHMVRSILGITASTRRGNMKSKLLSSTSLSLAVVPWRAWSRFVRSLLFFLASSPIDSPGSRFVHF